MRQHGVSIGTRIISGIGLLVLLIGLLYAGGPVLLVAMLVINDWTL